MRNILIIAGPFLLFAYGAHANCSTSTLEGEYSFTVHGHALSADGNTSTALIDGVGKIMFDGAGNATQEDFIIRNGIQVPGGPPNRSGFHTGETGTYTVASDCTGVLSLTLGPGNTRTEGFVITRRGQALHATVSEATANGVPILLQTYADFERLDAR